MNSDIFAAAALLLVLEGIMPFISPARWRYFILRVAEQSDSALRIMGFTSMLIGAVLLYLVRKHSF